MDCDNKIKIIDYLMSQFNTNESIQHVNGFQSDKAQCASFLSDFALSLLGEEEGSLLALQNLRRNTDDIWTFRIAHEIDKLNQKESDQLYMTYPIGKIKEYIRSDSIISKKDFFTEVYLRIEKLRAVIEANRGNDKKFFFNQKKGDHKGYDPKTEEACRDNIFLRIQDKYDDLILTKEMHEADNRVDINIKYSADKSFEVQVECKRDDNKGINTGISEQLIGKYFSSGVQYGIYLIFYFGDKKNKELLLQKVNKGILEAYRDKIKIVCIDLTLPEKEVSK